MLGDVSPQNIRLTSQPVVYLGRDHATRVTVEKLEGRSYKLADLQDLTRVVLVFPSVSPVVVFDSEVDAIFDYTSEPGVMLISLAGYDMPVSILPSYLVVYDAQHTRGQVLVDNVDTTLDFEFRFVDSVGFNGQPLPVCGCVRVDICVVPGTTYRDVATIMQPVNAYASVTSIAGAPVIVTAPGHGLTADWIAWMRGVVGFPLINREPGVQAPHKVKYLTPDTLEINALSAVGFNPVGGQLIYQLPVDLTGATMQERFYVDDVLVLTLTLGAGLEVTAPGTVAKEMTPDQTALLVGTRVSYVFEVTFADSTVTRYFEGLVT